MAKYRDQRRIGQVEKESSSPVAQVHTWPAWQGSARAADQVRPREDFTELHRKHHILAFPSANTREAQALEHAQQLSKLQRRGTASECSEAVDPERGEQPDLLGEEAASDSIRWSW
jgi:hypothetical protein